MTTPSEELDPKDIELFDLQREVKRFKDALRAADNYAAQLRAEAERLETCWQRDSFRLLFAERENERLRVLVRQVRADFSLAMPFVSGEHGSTAQRSWHERARQALEREK